MLEYITQEPMADADQERGHAIPFHSDQIFKLNKTFINAKFFESEAINDAQKKNAAVDASSSSFGQKSISSSQMIDVYMTPTQSDEEFSEESISPPEEPMPPMQDCNIDETEIENKTAETNSTIQGFKVQEEETKTVTLQSSVVSDELEANTEPKLDQEQPENNPSGTAA